MKETVSAWQRRTGGRYAPPTSHTAAARALAPDEACPTLFRYPCPSGLRDALQGQLERLGPGGEERWLWMAESLPAMGVPGPDRFGALVVLDPLRFTPCLLDEGRWIGVNRAVPYDPARLPWVPAAVANAPLPWDDLRSADEVREAFGADYDELMDATVRELSAYLEEISAMAASGAPGPDRAWCAVPREERERLIAAHGVQARWTGDFA